MNSKMADTVIKKQALHVFFLSIPLFQSWPKGVNMVGKGGFRGCGRVKGILAIMLQSLLALQCSFMMTNNLMTSMADYNNEKGPQLKKNGTKHSTIYIYGCGISQCIHSLLYLFNHLRA